MRSLVMAALSLISSVAAAAAVQDASDPAKQENEEIVVKGRNERQQAREFVDALTEVPRDGGAKQIRQFVWDVCPVVIGLGDAHKAAIVRRMRQVAAEVGMPVAKEKCSPNVILVVTDDNAALAAGMMKRYPRWFDGVLNHDWRKLKKESGPVTVWQNEMLIRETPDVSRIISPVQPVFVNAFILVDVQAVNGLSIEQLADYTALRGFARTDPGRAAATGTPTILTLFDDRAAGRVLPASLTDWDLHFLKSLYATRNDLFATYQRGSIKRQFEKELEQQRLRDSETQEREGEKP